ncbi:FAD-binding protein [Micromonospora sp. ATA51]|uniref:FAD-binding protein n=1 Tax=Micromonospora sp. ATA51 TaxID=2806098 RepID=UPI0028150DFA|nr:FAD-binding protein [Micromonospora sp. ATA51]
MVTPADADQVAALLRHSRRSGTPLTFRSGGTSLSGQAVTDQLLVDTRRHFRELTVLDDGRRSGCSPASCCARSTTGSPRTAASSAPTRPASPPAPSAASSPTTPAG